MIELRVLAASDIATIHKWPTYPPEFADLDYALRADGWLAEHRNRQDTSIYVAELGGEMIAFTLLSRTGVAEAEFRIALRADKVGQGLGRTITSMMLTRGFAELRLARINLIARKKNSRAIRLYQSLGFVECGECLKNVNGKQVSFLEMEISTEKYQDLLANRYVERKIMNTPVTKGVHHIGLTVAKLEESAEFFTALLGWKEVRRNNEYPAIYVSDGTTMISLWATKEPACQFDKNKNIGLHHVAFHVENEIDLNNIHEKIVRNRITVEFSPERLGQGPAKHMMCFEPSGIRVEFIWPGI